jgi:hypothetical protein
MRVSCCRMKEEYILVSSDGPDRNVLKLKPPLVFSHDNVDHFVKILDEVLTEISDSEVSENSYLLCSDINCTRHFIELSCPLYCCIKIKVKLSLCTP